MHKEMSHPDGTILKNKYPPILLKYNHIQNVKLQDRFSCTLYYNIHVEICIVRPIY